MMQESWAALDGALAWFRDSVDADHDAALIFSPALTKTQRAQVHTSAEAVGLGGLGTVSSGVGDQRMVRVVRKGSEASRAAAAERHAQLTPEKEDRALLMWRWAQEEGIEVSRDEAVDLVVSGAEMPPQVAQMWRRRWPRQEAAEEVCMAVVSRDQVQIKVSQSLGIYIKVSFSIAKR